MTRRATLFTQAEVKRAVAAVQASGLPVSRVTFLPEGGFEISTEATSPNKGAALDDWLERHGGSS
jgi:hypothetical protein